MARCSRTNFKARGINVPAGVAYWVDANGRQLTIVGKAPKDGQVHYADVPHGSIYLPRPDGPPIKLPYSPSMSRGGAHKQVVPTHTLLTIRRSQGAQALSALVEYSTSVHGVGEAHLGAGFELALPFLLAQGVTPELARGLSAMGVDDWRYWVALGPREPVPDYTKRVVVANLVATSSFDVSVRGGLADLLYEAHDWWTTSVERQELVIDNPVLLLKEVLRSGRALPEAVERLSDGARYAQITGEAAEFFLTRPTDATLWLAQHASSKKLRNKLLASPSREVRDAVRGGSGLGGVEEAF